MVVIEARELVLLATERAGDQLPKTRKLPGFGQVTLHKAQDTWTYPHKKAKQHKVTKGTGKAWDPVRYGRGPTASGRSRTWRPYCSRNAGRKNGSGSGRGRERSTSSSSGACAKRTDLNEIRE
jgi:hypothetical protein